MKSDAQIGPKWRRVADKVVKIGHFNHKFDQLRENLESENTIILTYHLDAWYIMILSQLGKKPTY